MSPLECLHTPIHPFLYSRSSGLGSLKPWTPIHSTARSGHDDCSKSAHHIPGVRVDVAMLFFSSETIRQPGFGVGLRSLIPCNVPPASSSGNIPTREYAICVQTDDEEFRVRAECVASMIPDEAALCSDLVDQIPFMLVEIMSWHSFSLPFLWCDRPTQELLDFLSGSSWEHAQHKIFDHPLPDGGSIL